MGGKGSGPKRKTHDEVVGTSSGAAWHRYRGERPCEACRKAHTERIQQAKKAKAAAKREAGRVARVSGRSSSHDWHNPMDGYEVPW